MTQEHYFTDQILTTKYSISSHFKSRKMKSLKIFIVAALLFAACTKENTHSSSVSSAQSTNIIVDGIVIYSDDRAVKIAQDPDFKQYRINMRLYDSVHRISLFNAVNAGRTPDLSKWQTGEMTLTEFDNLCKRTGFRDYQQFWSWQTTMNRYGEALKAKFNVITEDEWHKAIILTEGDGYFVDDKCVHAYSGCMTNIAITFNNTMAVCFGAGMAAMWGTSPAGGAIIYIVCGGMAMHNEHLGEVYCAEKYKECRAGNTTGTTYIKAIPPFKPIIKEDIRWDLVTFRRIGGQL